MGRFALAVVVLAIFLSVSSCQTTPPPLEEYSIARAAIESARSVQAPRYSPGYWHQADEAYRKGQLYYRDHDWGNAKAEFLRARQSAEKAENSARLIRQKTGEVL